CHRRRLVLASSRGQRDVGRPQVEPDRRAFHLRPPPPRARRRWDPCLRPPPAASPPPPSSRDAPAALGREAFPPDFPPSGSPRDRSPPAPRWDRLRFPAVAGAA